MFDADQILNSLLKEIARQAYVAGYRARSRETDCAPEQWWAEFVEQNHTDG